MPCWCIRNNVLAEEYLTEYIMNCFDGNIKDNLFKMDKNIKTLLVLSPMA
jgi:hypothetical protein